MEKLQQTIIKYNPVLYKNLVKSDLNEERINNLFKENGVGGYLPTDVIDLYKIFNGTLLNYENERGQALRVDPNSFFFSNGYLLDIETAITTFENNKKKFIKKGEIYFPIFGTGLDIYCAIILNKDPNNLTDINGLFEFISSKNPARIYDTFSSFIETTIQAYEQGMYYINSNNLFCIKSFEKSRLKEKLNPNSKPWG